MGHFNTLHVLDSHMNWLDVQLHCEWQHTHMWQLDTLHILDSHVSWQLY